eukprot:CAMPEP_0177761580 /NCGR_PEP_ID=MMETSP0491_2-20121128/5881_1 /TAXON_ID=63592 /ORGANISM="Tetraselmis chuii, Strain PLY429" /LENGTH=125 /DNA_ID=CAMNT_0019277565 /DNA_START=1770 /DNA_END=2147 /DNA_ORIENTATION=-
MGGKPSRESGHPVPPTGYEPVVNGRREPDSAPPPGWYWSHDTYFTCPTILCFCCCEKHRWVLRPETSQQPAYGGGGQVVQAADGTAYFGPKVERHPYNGPTYGNQSPQKASVSGFQASQKAMPTI